MRIPARAIRTAALCGACLFSAAAHANGAGPLALAPMAAAQHPVAVETGALDGLAPPFIENGLAAFLNALDTSPFAQSLVSALARPEVAIAIGALFLLLIGGLIAFRFLRPHGSLSLRLLFPDDLKGEFEVQLHRPGRHDRTPTPRRFSLRTRLLRGSVRRETQFDRIPPGRWVLTIEGRLRAQSSRTVLARISERETLTIRPHACHEMEHALPPIEAPVEIQVHWDRQPARHFGLGIVGARRAVRYAEKGALKVTLPLGTHTVAIGASDRVLEQQIEVTSYEPNRVEIDLARPKGLVFKGCPPAVSAFLQGDLDEAARALSRDGQAQMGALLLARLHRAHGENTRAAEELEKAGHTQDAAKLRREISDFDRAAELFSQAGETRSAAEMYDAASDWSKAARAYAELEEWKEAARCFEAAGEIPGWIDALERQGLIFRAAALASEHEDRARSIALLQQIGPHDPDFGRAGELLALAYEQEGHLDLAAHQLERCLSLLPPGENVPQLEVHLSELLDDTGQTARALEVLESLRDRDPTYPGVAGRIESLRKKLSGPLREVSVSSYRAPIRPTPFVAADRYEILEEVGRGGMSHVYKARDRRLERIVALKRMPENLLDHPAAVQLFLGEAQAAARMNHPNIVTLYDADQEQGRFFITMELLEGLPLNIILEERARFGPRDTARLGVQACAGLQFAHDQGIVHRDIKTSNLFITRDRVLKIMDFGLAKMLQVVRDGHATVIAGSPFYMAPEQAAGRVADGRTDLYGLGVTLFELSTGTLPFSEGDIGDQHRHAPRPSPADRVRDYPPKLAELIQQLMAIDPEERPHSAKDVIEVLTEVIETR